MVKNIIINISFQSEAKQLNFTWSLATMSASPSWHEAPCKRNYHIF